MQGTALVFNALNGQELKAYILSEIGKKLDATGEFEGHVSFPWVKYSFKVDFVCYPKQAVDDAPGIVVKGDYAAEGPVPDIPPTFVVVDGEGTVDTPDLARLDAGLPLPTVAPGPGDILIDKPVQPPAPETKQNRKGTFPKKAEVAHVGTESSSGSSAS